MKLVTDNISQSRSFFKGLQIFCLFSFLLLIHCNQKDSSLRNIRPRSEKPKRDQEQKLRRDMLDQFQMASFGWIDLFEIVQAVLPHETKVNPTNCLQKRDQTLLWDCRLSSSNAYARMGQAHITQKGSNWTVQTEGEGLSIFFTVGKKYLVAHQTFKLEFVQGENNVFHVKMNSFLNVDFVNGLMMQKNDLQWNLTGSLILKELLWGLQQLDMTFLLSKSVVPVQGVTDSLSPGEVEVSGDQTAEIVADYKRQWSLINREEVELVSCGIPVGQFEFSQESKESFFIVSHQKEGFFEVTQKKIKNSWPVCKEPLYGFMVLHRPWVRFLLNAGSF